MQIIVGYWMDGLENDLWCLPQELPRIDMSDKEAVVKFLRAGTVAETYRGYSWCRHLCGIPYEHMGHRDLMNGPWVYPEGFVHYVETHDVAVPPQLVNAAHGGLSERLPETLWQDFCISHFKPELRQSLDRLRSRVQADIRILQDEASDRREVLRGLSDSICIWAGCQRRALNGIALCSRHWDPGDHSIIATNTSQRAFSEFLKHANELA